MKPACMKNYKFEGINQKKNILSEYVDNLEHDQNVRCPENLARASVGMWEEALNFLDFFVSFLCQDKNESLSGRIILRHVTTGK